MVSLKNITKNYRLGTVEVKALKGINIDINEGEFLSISGPSGSGKTTCLNLIGCLDIPTSGKVCLMGKDISLLSDSSLSKLRNKYIGFIFQTFNLIPVLNTYENVEYPLLLLDMTKKERKRRILSILEEIGLADFVKHRPNELSGGQRQRVAIARALVTDPKLVLADEPTASLDSKTGLEILELMKRMNNDHKTTFIFSTHDPNILKFAEKVFDIRDGRIIS